MKKKKFLAVLLAAAMVFSLAACGGKSSSEMQVKKMHLLSGHGIRILLHWKIF